MNAFRRWLASIDYDPSEPRKPGGPGGGEWTKGGGSGAPAEHHVYVSRQGATVASTSPAKAGEDWPAEVKRRVEAQADQDGYPRRHIEVVSGKEATELAGAEYNTLAWYDPDTGKIQFFSDTMKDQGALGSGATTEGTASHEIMHAKTHLWKQANKDIAKKLDGGVTMFGRDWKKPLAEGLATPEQLEKDDGVTPYSTATWQRWAESQDPSQDDEDKLRFNLPFGETISEMRAVERETGKLPGTPAWQKVYHAIEGAWKEALKTKADPRLQP